jgi:uncharacterized membrane protein (UPF0182 family)
MFLFAYAIVVIIAAIPLAMTLSARGRGLTGLALAHRLYRDFAYIAAAIVAIAAFEIALKISLESYWFSELGQAPRFWFVLGLQVTIFAVVFVAGGLFIAVNLWLVMRSRPALPPTAPWIAGFVVAGLIGYGATVLWTPLTAFLGAAPAGVSDPLFGKDLSFYLLRLPFYQVAVRLLITVTVLTVIAWAVLGLVFSEPGRRFGHLLQRGAVPGAGTSEEEVVQRFFISRPIDREAWLTQGMALGALLCLAFALQAFLARYRLVIDGHSRVVAGAAWIDTHFWAPAFAVFVAAWLAAALFLAAAAAHPPLRRWFLIGRAHRTLVGGVLAAVFLIAFIIPTVVENLYVGPNQITLERPYLERSITGTRRAFGLEGPNVAEQTYAVSTKPIARADLDANAATLRDARIWDWRALEPQLQQTQGLRPYYNFSGVDLDRYQIDGAERQVLITARELDAQKLPAQAQVWVNLALKYTHGYGVVAAPTNEIDGQGNPVLWAHDIPIEAKGDLAVAHGEIYYGMQTNDRVYVHTTEKEFDYPRGDANMETVYGGAGGVGLSSFWRKLVVARAYDGLRLFISSYFTPDSRILIRRNVVERVWRLAPFLTFDRDPYIVADGDHYDYILDGYTSSANYPYSEAYGGSVDAFGGRNYLRNAVKAVVDAYNGSVTFYVFAPDDPIIKAYRKMLPGLFKDASAMPDSLRRHVRYPEDLFTVQAEMYGVYHMTNPTTFYNREDRWEVPRELYRDTEVEVSPYYVMAQLPGETAPEFVLMLPLSVAGKNQMAGWLAGRSDGANYGKLVAYRFPKGQFIDGPAQVESRINSDSRFSPDLTLWDQHGSSVIRGNLIILPLAGGQLAAIEPVYIEAEQTKIPTLARVVFGQLLPDDRKIEWAPTLGDAEALVSGEPEGEVVAGGAGAGAVGSAGAPGVAGAGQDRLERARAVFGEMQAAYAAGDYVRYGQLMQELKGVLGAGDAGKGGAGP